MPRSELVLIRASDMRVRWFVLEFDAVEFGTPHDVLLLSDCKSLPLDYSVLPLLKQEDRTGGARNSGGQEGVGRSIEQCRILALWQAPIFRKWLVLVPRVAGGGAAYESGMEVSSRNWRSESMRIS